ncbi:MAG: hypothetical protein K2H18_00195 [Muribaculaceae bacterium]|nr:hypothetical protein [Muribaculaceae bacterium]
MKIEIKEVISKVLARLDESEDVLDDAVEYGSPSYDSRKLIEDLIPEAAERVVSEAPIEDISEWEPLEGIVKPVYVGAVIVRRILPVPEDYMRFVYLRMSDWPEGVTRLFDSRSDAAALRRYWRLRNERDERSPAVGIGYHDRERVFEIFGSVNGSRMVEGGYIPRPRADGEGNLVFPPSLRGELVECLVKTIKEIRR